MQTIPNLALGKVSDFEGVGFVYVIEGNDAVPYLIGGCRDGDATLAIASPK
jgi:hypothetical protein